METKAEILKKSVDEKSNYSKANTTKIAVLPPTDKVIFQNMAQVHIQITAWQNSLETNAVVLDPTSHSWYMKKGSDSIAAVV